MNYQVDVIIIGDSKSGHEMLDKLASSKPKVRFAFVSQTFKSTTTHDYNSVKYFRDEVVYTSYRHRLFSCYLKNGDIIFGTHMIIASGINYEPLMLNNELVPCVFNTLDDLPKTAKDQPAVVVANQVSDFKFALDVAKKYKQVYLCTGNISLGEITEATNKKLTKIDNLVVLPNTSIQKAISENKALKKIELDNYSTVNCSAIFVKTATKPATDFIPKKLMLRDNLGYLTVSDTSESTLVPKCFAIGNCVKKYTKAIEQKVIDAILKDF